LGRGSPFNVSYQNCCKKNIYVNDSQNLAFATSHFVIELLPFDYLSNQKQQKNEFPTPFVLFPSALILVRDSSAVRQFFFLLELWDIRERYIRKTADLPLQLLVGTFPRFVAIKFFFVSENLI
jgi:hypothetical protein